MPVSPMIEPSHEPITMAAIVAASATAPVCSTVVVMLFFSPINGAPAMKPITTPSSTSTNAVGTFRVSMTPTPTAMTRRIAIPISLPLGRRSDPGGELAQRRGEQDRGAAQPDRLGGEAMRGHLGDPHDVRGDR